MPKQKPPVLIEANRTVTVTILARHAFGLAMDAERHRAGQFEKCGKDGSEDLKRALTRASDEWKRTSEVLAEAYEESLSGEQGYHAPFAARGGRP
mgnify:FL=1